MFSHCGLTADLQGISSNSNTFYPELSNSSTYYEENALYNENSEPHIECCKSTKTNHSSSPVKILQESTLSIDLPPISWHNYQSVPKILNVINTGRTILINGNWTKNRPYITGGPLNGNYIFSQIHFHSPSEHEIDGMRYPLEMHVVHYKTCYLTQEKAMEEKDGTVVIVYLFQVLNSKKSVLSSIANSIHLIERINDRTELSNVTLNQILQPIVSNYYIYCGSVSTSKNSYSLKWIINCNNLCVTQNEMDKIVKILCHDESFAESQMSQTNIINNIIYRVEEYDSAPEEVKCRDCNNVTPACYCRYHCQNCKICVIHKEEYPQPNMTESRSCASKEFKKRDKESQTSSCEKTSKATSLCEKTSLCVIKQVPNDKNKNVEATVTSSSSSVNSNSQSSVCKIKKKTKKKKDAHKVPSCSVIVETSNCNDLGLEKQIDFTEPESCTSCPSTEKNLKIKFCAAVKSLEKKDQKAKRKKVQKSETSSCETLKSSSKGSVKSSKTSNKKQKITKNSSEGKVTDSNSKLNKSNRKEKQTKDEQKIKKNKKSESSLTASSKSSGGIKKEKKNKKSESSLTANSKSSGGIKKEKKNKKSESSLAASSKGSGGIKKEKKNQKSESSLAASSKSSGDIKKEKKKQESKTSEKCDLQLQVQCMPVLVRTDKNEEGLLEIKSNFLEEKKEEGETKKLEKEIEDLSAVCRESLQPLKDVEANKTSVCSESDEIKTIFKKKGSINDLALDGNDYTINFLLAPNSLLKKHSFMTSESECLEIEKNINSNCSSAVDKSINRISKLELSSVESQEKSRDICFETEHFFHTERKGDFSTCVIQEYNVAVICNHNIIQEFRGIFHPNDLELGMYEKLHLVPKYPDPENISVRLENCFVKKETLDQLYIRVKFLIEKVNVNDIKTKAGNIFEEDIKAPNLETSDVKNYKADYVKEEKHDRDNVTEKEKNPNQSDLKNKVLKHDECKSVLLKKYESNPKQSNKNIAFDSLQQSSKPKKEIEKKEDNLIEKTDKTIKDIFCKGKKVYFSCKKVEKDKNSGKKVFVGSFKTKEELKALSNEKKSAQKTDISTSTEKSLGTDKEKFMSSSEESFEELLKTERPKAQEESPVKFDKSDKSDESKNLITLHRHKPKNLQVNSNKDESKNTKLRIEKS